MTSSTKVPTPDDMDEAGAHLWESIVGKWDLRPDELRVLEDACREADLVALMEASRRSESFTLFVFGSQGQQVINPLISELRQHRSTLAGLLRQLKLPEENPEAEAAKRSATMRAVANARWSTRGGA